MGEEIIHELCRDCLNRESCDYIPVGGKLIRCLDRRVAQNPHEEEKEQSEENRKEEVLQTPAEEG